MTCNLEILQRYRHKWTCLYYVFAVWQTTTSSLIYAQIVSSFARLLFCSLESFASLRILVVLYLTREILIAILTRPIWYAWAKAEDQTT